MSFHHNRGDIFHTIQSLEILQTLIPQCSSFSFICMCFSYCETAICFGNNSGIMVFASLFYARVMRIPLVLSYHTHLPVYARNYFTFWPGDEVKLAWSLLRWVHSRADLTLCTSPNIKKELEDNGIPRVDIWRKGIDTVKFNPKFKCEEMKRKMSDGHPDDFLLVYIGRLGDEKRLKDIRPMLERMGPNTRLCFVGGGPQEDELHEYFTGTNTVFTGQLSGDDLSKAFASADVFVMPSDSEVSK